MVVQHNMQAMNTNRQLGITTGLQAKSTEKLSSGFRVNRAGDDAAGLAISEKMRSFNPSAYERACYTGSERYEYIYGQEPDPA